MYENVTGVILAGGNNSRYQGRNKAFLALDGITILDRIQSVFETLFPKIILVTNDPLAYKDKDFLIVSDIYPMRSALTGLHAGLFYTETEYAFFTACDTPFLNPAVLRLILDKADGSSDVIVPDTKEGMQPLFSAYSIRCLKPIEHRLEKSVFNIRSFFKSVKVRTVSEKALRAVDPDLSSFFNINSPEDFKNAEEILALKY